MPRSRVFAATKTVLLVSVFIAGCADNGRSAMGASAPDAEITAAVRSAIAQHPDLGGSNQIQVATRKGVVYLSGIVGDDLAAEDAQDLAWHVPGVARVVNMVSVSQ